eukprot:1254743-Prymnesium_polylepis.1
MGHGVKARTAVRHWGLVRDPGHFNRPNNAAERRAAATHEDPAELESRARHVPEDHRSFLH